MSFLVRAAARSGSLGVQMARTVPACQWRLFSTDAEEKINRQKMQDMMVEKLKKQADATVVKIKDISYDAGYLLEMLVVSPKFRGMKLIQQHRLMNKILSDELSILHGITFKCMTPEQYEKMDEK
ncbi:BolA domain protein [Blastocystis sp. ATCC 50177/Nand II]|uniref:BolA domain protein n=1 Tax=Blastocystis sp. subtype 1 (strain ATCC 50177 / NandII) TaxID=478820 RepID=A0A196SG18_BLAHN|nr:BolA domain protein [Blastocystis sp. ATCC 50177/Nand II]